MERIWLDISMGCILCRRYSHIIPNIGRNCKFYSDGALHGRLDLGLGHHGLVERILMLGTPELK